MMELILKLGGNPNTASSCGTTPIYMAVSQNDIAMTRLLLKAHANPNVTIKSITPLVKAEEFKNTKMIKLLKQYGAKEY
jgi:ankyrin repeat protein